VTGRIAIAVSDLRKWYGSTRAVDGVDLQVETGSVFALLGPNGAGKTTTIEILEGYRSPDAGTVQVLGLDPLRDAGALRPRVGLMLQSTGLYELLEARELVALFCAYYPRPAAPVELLELVGLERQARARFRALSGGQKQRMALALALAGQPELLFLDEPTAGMDPQMRHQTWGIIRKQREQGRTVILTTHYMEEAERLADRVAIMDRGRLVAEGTPAVLTRRLGARVVRFAAPVAIGPETLRRLDGLAVEEELPGSYRIVGPDPLLVIETVARWARQERIPLTRLGLEEATLEEVFLKLTGEAIRE